jgi:DNA-binding winged helix-turn-helix (wHTH) protein/predicted ATPase
VKLTEDIIFPPFRLDPANEQLWRGDHLVPLRPKTFAVLRCLAEQAGRLVTKEELLKAVWSNTRVSDGILKGYIRDLREVLGDDSQQPRFIETVPRRGHRFIAAVTSTAPVLSSESQVLSPSPSPTPNPQSLAPLLVGREAELSQLDRWFAKALRGERQMVFVTGEPGIGKTTVVDVFLQQLLETGPSSQASRFQSLTSSPWIGRGQCVEQHGAGEAYLPVLEALGRIGRAPGGERFVTLLHQHAPTWLVQMPALLTARELETVQQRVVGATRERMLREMVEAIEVLTVAHPLVLWFEDLHWADASTVDWLAAVANQRTPARLLVVGTYRPSDLSLRGHPLKAVKQELVAKRQCEELWLPFLSAEDVTHYLTRRCARHQFPSGLGTAIHRRTDGNPLFVVNMVEYLIAQDVIVERDGAWRLQARVDEVSRGVPESLRQLIEKHIERLSEEHRQLLEVASIVGGTFSATAVAAGLQVEVETVEQQCEALARIGHFLRSQGVEEWPDGSMGGQYSFLHALYQQGLYERIPEARRIRLHRRIGEQKATAYGERAREIASELAAHFSAGRDFHHAVRFLRVAAENAVQRHAHQEAVGHLKKALALLPSLPDIPERIQQELMLQLTLGEQLTSLQGFGVSEVEQAFARARALCRQLGDTPQLFRVVLGLWAFYVERAELTTAYELAEQLLRTARQVQAAGLLVWAHLTMGITHHFAGEQMSARQHLEECLSRYDPQQFRNPGSPYDPAVLSLSTLGPVLWLLGYPDQALAQSEKGLALAGELTQQYSVVYASTLVARTRLLRCERQAVQARIDELIALCEEYGFTSYLALSRIVRGWLLADEGKHEEGIQQMCQQLLAWRATGAESARPYYLAFLAETHGKAGAPAEGLTVLAECWPWMDKTGGRVFEAELHRVQGELTLRKFQVSGFKFQVPPSTQPPTPHTRAEAEAEACFRKAIEVARQQQAKSLELRAVMSLVRLRQHQALREARTRSKKGDSALAEAHQMLLSVYNWFTEGFETKDLQEAKALLEELA